MSCEPCQGGPVFPQGRFDDCQRTPLGHTSPFAPLFILPRPGGGATVSFSLDRRFCDPGPYTTQLEVAPAGVLDEAAWCVADTGSGLSSLVDDEDRAYGSSRLAHYRVRITTPEGEYVSSPAPTTGNLSRRDWLRAKDLVRRESLRLRKEAGVRGFLLKRRIFGQACPCVDAATGHSRDPHCPDCYGTSVLGGYYQPIADFYVDNTAHGHDTKSDAQRGTIDDATRVAGRMLNIPQLASRDVWVEHDTDNRWELRGLAPAREAVVRGLPTILTAELRLLSFDHPLYSLTIER